MCVMTRAPVNPATLRQSSSVPNMEGDIMLVRSPFEGSCRGGGRAVGDDRASGGVGDEGGGLDAVL